MRKTYHDSIEAAYRGKMMVLTGAGMHALPPLRNYRDRLDQLVNTPSYHFGQMIHLHSGDPRIVRDPPIADIIQLMNDLGIDKASLVFDSVVDPNTNIVTLDLTSGELRVSIAFYDDAKALWVAFDDRIANNVEIAGPFIWAGHTGLALLANPSIQYVVRDPSSGVAALNEARVKRGERPAADMQVIHLTKRVYIGGRTIEPNATGTGSERSPHDRAGHWRHSKRSHPGWEAVTPTSGEWAGVSCYRRWIDDSKIKGGAPDSGPGRGHPKAAQPKAPQFRVVR